PRVEREKKTNAKGRRIRCNLRTHAGPAHDGGRCGWAEAATRSEHRTHTMTQTYGPRRDRHHRRARRARRRRIGPRSVRSTPYVASRTVKKVLDCSEMDSYLASGSSDVQTDPRHSP